MRLPRRLARALGPGFTRGNLSTVIFSGRRYSRKQLNGLRFAAMRARLAILVAVLSAVVAVPASAGATTCANREAEARDADGVVVEIAVLCETNNRRVAEGLAPLRLNAQLVAAARAHAHDMVARGYFAHVTPEGLGPTERAAAQGYVAAGCCGENIAQGHDSAQHVVESWMDSPGHRANILNGSYQEIGVGVVGATYVQVFSDGLLAPGISGLEPEYQGNAGRDPGVSVQLMGSGGGALLRATSASPAALQFTATDLRRGAVQRFDRAGNGVEPPPLPAGVWRLCWELAAVDPYAGDSGCIDRDVRIETTAGLRLLPLTGARVDLLAGAAVGQSAHLIVQRRIRPCARCALAPWHTVRRLALTLRQRQRLRFAHAVAGSARVRVVLDVATFERDGVPYRPTHASVRLRLPARDD
jgi:uncharacterized protein YkwD